MSLIAGFEHIVRENEPLAPFTRLKLGGVAEYFAEPTNVNELIGLLQRFSQNDLPIRLIGSGSNVLIRNGGVPGLVLRLSAPDFCQIEIKGQTLTAGGGTQLSHFVASTVREGFAGPEQLVGMTGTVGAALYYNTGSSGSDMGSWVESVDLISRTGERTTKKSNELSFSYRQSSITELAVLKARFKFDQESPEILTKQMQKRWIVRRASQPGWDENATFIFKDHGGESAESLIDQAGLKGTRIGGVAISDRNSNYFVADANATSQDVLRLIELIKSTVRDRLEIELEEALTVW